MRQLKFRICYTDRQDNKYIIYDPNLCGITQNFHIGLDGNILENYGDCVWQVPFDVWDHPFIQQSTGMKDCDGVEIYEGDLVSFKVNALAEILSFENQEVKYLDDYAMFIFGDYCLRDYIIHESIEVTGNIYE
jgi:hypothetical protein